ncbi:MAG: hypothetical protein KF832_31095 [Caldilineaceae bacterium]|nr:hypothetical protein [Caldilineaceae bacterium]
MLLRITDGTTTVILHDDGGTPSVGLAGARYFPREPGSDETVNERADVVFKGNTETVLSTIGTIERLLQAAGAVDTYLEYSRNGLHIHRSPVLSGRVVWSEARIDRRIYGAGNTIGEVTVVWERANYWEGSETNIGSFTVRNGNSAPYNVIDLLPVNGNLPSPAKVQIYNNNGVEIDARNFYVNLDAFAGMAGTEHLLAGATVSWAGAITHNNLLWLLPLTTSFLTKNAGKAVQVMAAYTTLSMGIFLRASLYRARDGLYVPMQHANEHYVSGHLNPLGTLTLPRAVTAGIVLALTAYTPSAGSGTLSFVQLVPADGALWLDLGGYGWKSEESVVEEGAAAHAYVVSGSARLNLVSRSGGPLLLWPGRQNRLHLLFDEGSGTYQPTRTATLLVSYRPRRATV